MCESRVGIHVHVIYSQFSQYSAIQGNILSKQFPCSVLVCHVCYTQISQRNPCVCPVSVAAAPAVIAGYVCHIPLTCKTVLNMETICNAVRGLIVSLWLCITFRSSGQRRAMSEILRYRFFLFCFSSILQQEGHKFMYDLRHFFEVFLTQCTDMHIRLICIAKLSLGVNSSVACCLSPCDEDISGSSTDCKWMNIVQNHRNK